MDRTLRSVRRLRVTLPPRLCPMSLLRLVLLTLPLLAWPVLAQPPTPAPLTPVAAQRVAYATHAMLLAATRAGARIVAVGDHGIVLLSDDNGRSFRQARAVPIDSTLTGVSFIDAREGWAVGHWGSILHSNDGGETWSLQRSDVTTDRPLFAVQFFDARRGVAVGLWSLVLTTEDGGAHWQAVTPAPPEGAKKADLNLYGLFADARGRVYATAERGMLLRSDDFGHSWSYLPTGYKGSLWTGLAAADGSLYAAGLRGSLVQSDDDGRSWRQLQTGSTASISAMAQVGRDVIAVGADGLLLRHRAGTAGFDATPRSDRLSLTAVVGAADGHAVLFSRQGVVADAKP